MSASFPTSPTDDVPIVVQGIHPALFIQPLLAFAFWTAVAQYLPTFVSDPWLSRAGWAVAGIALLGVLRMVIVYTSHRIVLTAQHIRTTSGVLSRATVELQISQLESITVTRPFWGRLFGYGNIALTGSGGTQRYFNGMRDPEIFRDQVVKHIALQRRSGGA